MSKRGAAEYPIETQVVLRLGDALYDKLEERAKTLRENMPGMTITMTDVIRENLWRGLSRDDD